MLGVCVYVLTHTIAALVTAIVVEGDCNGRVVMEEVVMEAVAMEGDHSSSAFTPCMPHMHNDQGVNGFEHVIAGTNIPEIFLSHAHTHKT